MGRERDFDEVLSDVVQLVERARRASARSVNAILTSTYWAIGRRIVEEEQKGEARAAYGEELVKRLAAALTVKLGRGFGWRLLANTRAFYQAYRDRPGFEKLHTAYANSSAKKLPTARTKAQGRKTSSAPVFPLPWSHYVRLVRVESTAARIFYEAEALRGGWTVRQLERQVATDFFGRTRRSRKAPSLSRQRTEERLTPEEEIRDPYVLEFLGLKDDYSESDLEEALIRQLESFLLELGGDFTFGPGASGAAG